MSDDQRTDREMRWELEGGGTVFVSFPNIIGPADVDDLQDLTALWLRGLNRRSESALEIDGEWAE